MDDQAHSKSHRFFLPEDVPEENIRTFRTAVNGTTTAMRVYRWYEVAEEQNRQMSQFVAKTAIDLVQRSLELRTLYFLPGSEMRQPDSPNGVPADHFRLSFEYRLGQLTLTVGTAKVCLDAALAGYYTQCLSLCRGQFESWKRVAYVRRSPMSAFKFFPAEWVPDSIKLAPNYVHPGYGWRPGDWDDVFPKDDQRTEKDNSDRRMLDIAKAHTENLNEHTHPSMTGYGQHLMDRSRYNIGIQPQFSERHVWTALHELNVTEFLLMQEIRLLMLPDEQWTSRLEEWENDFHGFYSE